MTGIDHVLLIGGPAGAGKTTIARLLARRHGLRWYNADAHTWSHRDRALAAGIELPERGPGSHLYDRRPMLLADLRALPLAPLVVAEGAPVAPEMAAAAGAAVWLMPSRAVQRDRLTQRHPTGVPEAYLASWDRVAEQLAAYDVPTLEVDGQDVAETLHAVEQCFGTALAAGPTAGTRTERQRLIRDGNQAIITQCLSPSTRPLGTYTPETIVKDFDCECAAPDCTALVNLRVVEARDRATAAPPTICAEGHGAG